MRLIPLFVCYRARKSVKSGTFLNILFNIGSVGVFFHVAVVENDQCRRLADIEFLAQFRVSFRIDFFKIHMSFCQHTVSHLTVWTGGRRKEKNLVFGSRNFFLWLSFIIMDFLWLKNRGFNVVNLTVFKFFCLSLIPVLNRAVVTSDTAVYFCFTAADRTGILFAADVSMIFADRVGW